MTFLEHLDELRTRLIRILIALIVGVGIAFPFRNRLFNLLFLPQRLRIQNLLADFLGWVMGFGLQSRFLAFSEIWLRAHASDEAPIIPNFRSPMEPFIALFKLCIVAGLIIASPVVLYQIWMFIVPALKETEKRVAVRLAALMGVFFFAGISFAFFIAAPLLLELSANLWRSSEINLTPENLWTFNDYMGFLIQLILAFGIAFQLPLVMAFLVRLGIVTVGFYREKRRIAFFVLIATAAVVTPGDIVPMLVMAVPLLTLYEFGILLSALAAGKRRALVGVETNDDEPEST